MKIERDKVYLTRCGTKVRVICTDANEHMPVVGIDRHGIIDCYSKHGAYRFDGESANDLVSEYVEPPKPREVWVYPYSDGAGYGSAMTDAERAEHEQSNPTYASRLVKFREVIE